MNDQDPSASTENRLSEPESSPTPRGLSPGTSRARSGGNRQSRQSTTEPKQLKIVVRLTPAEAQPSSSPAEEVKAPDSSALNPPLSEEVKSLVEPSSEIIGQKISAEAEPQQIPARMMNEFVYCQRLFYYEFVEGVFVESVDTLRGAAIHQRVDSGNGALPAAKTKKKTEKMTEEKPSETTDVSAKETEAQHNEPETIHSRSVQMGSERLGIVSAFQFYDAGRAALLLRIHVGKNLARRLRFALSRRDG